MKFEMEGTIAVIFEKKTVGSKFEKREFVLDVKDGKYPQVILFETSGRTMADLDEYQDGDSVRVHFNVRGREWRKPGGGETKYFNTLAAWKLERVGEKAARRPAAPPQNSGGGFGGGGFGGADDDITF